MKLLPCPFCGSEVAPSHEGFESAPLPWVISHLTPQGGKCAIVDISFRTKEDAIARWNRRAAPAPALLSEPRELLCTLCGREHPTWYADNELWNRVVRLPDGSDRWPFLCPTCFTVKAAEAGETAPFRVSQGSEAGGVDAWWDGDLTGREPGAELNALRRAVASLLGEDEDTWPTHGNAPLAIAAALALELMRAHDSENRG